jgi:adenine-specific DNA-methyltransferase
VFHYPKDHIELARWFNLAASKDAKILDFFGGSGSTAEAVLLLNQQDGGTREVTLATNNDNNIGTDITRERVVRVMTGEGWADGKPHDGYGGKLAVWFVS